MMKNKKHVQIEQTLDSILDEHLATNKKFRKRWETLELVRNIKLALVKMRREANMTQKELAIAAGWKQSFVSRLENIPASGTISIPDIPTIKQYVDACEKDFGLIFGSQRDHTAHISTAVGFGEHEGFNDGIAALSDSDLLMQADNVVPTKSKLVAG